VGDDFLESLRRVAQRSTPVSFDATATRPIGRPSSASAVDSAPGVAAALRDLERRILDLDLRVRHLDEQRASLVEAVADAVVARLDARWARALEAEDRRGP
jgi:hypothetical protein